MFLTDLLNINKQNLHGTQFPTSGPRLNSWIPIKKLEKKKKKKFENGPHSAAPADMFLSSGPSFSHCLVIEVIFVNGVKACLS